MLRHINKRMVLTPGPRLRPRVDGCLELLIISIHSSAYDVRRTRLLILELLSLTN